MTIVVADDAFALDAGEQLDGFVFLVQNPAQKNKQLASGTNPNPIAKIILLRCLNMIRGSAVVLTRHSHG